MESLNTPNPEWQACASSAAPRRAAWPDRRRLLRAGLAGLALPALVPPARAFVGGPRPGQDGAAAAEPLAAWSGRVLLVRHAEKEPGEDPGLTPAGRRRAAALAALLARVPLVGLEHSGLQRTQQTVAPLAAATGLRPQSHDPHDVQGLQQRALALPDGAALLVAGHSNTLPAASAALGAVLGDLDPRGHLAEDAYDRLFVLTLVRWPEQPPLSSLLELCLPVGV